MCVLSMLKKASGCLLDSSEVGEETWEGGEGLAGCERAWPWVKEIAFTAFLIRRVPNGFVHQES